MVRSSWRRGLVFAAALFAAQGAAAAGKLEIEDAWIRVAPPTAPMRAGYAVLRNAGDTPLVIRAAHSAAFGDVSLHATVIDDGVARMRELDRLVIEPGESVKLEPGGRHLMLMQPAEALAPGASATIRFDTDDGVAGEAAFVVRDPDAPR